MSDINEKILAWEKKAYYKPNADDTRSRYFSRIVWYNKPFVEFLNYFYNLNEKVILDYGCGTGIFAQLFSIHSQNVFGCDLSQDVLEFAKKKTSQKIEYFEEDFFNSGLKKNTYDFILCRGLGPLQKIDYSEENVEYLQKIVSALKQEGTAYFTLLGNLSGGAGNRLSGFQNYRLNTIHKFFNQAGYVSMINVLGGQAVVLTKSQDLSKKHNQKMLLTVKNMLENLREFDEVGYLKAQSWMYVNTNSNEPIRKEFVRVEDYMKKHLYKLLVQGLCEQKNNFPDLKPIEEPIFFVGGDTDRNFEKKYVEKLFRYKIGHRVAKWTLKKFFRSK